MKSISLKQALLALIVILGIAACDPMALEETTTLDNSSLLTTTTQDLSLVTTDFCGEPKTVDLWAAQSIDAGDVTFYNDAEYLYVTITATWGFQDIKENIKMWLGTDIMLLPRSGQDNTGAPIPGDFPYKATLTEGNTYTFQILLSDIPTYYAKNCGKQAIFIVIHGDVYAESGSWLNAETAFGGEFNGDGNRWWYYSTYVPACCENVPPPETGVLETAFLKFDNSGDFGTGYVFTTMKKSNPEDYASLGLTRNRWGWAGNVTADGTYTFDIWAAAGLNDTDRGTLVGTGTISKNGDAVTVTYDMNSGFSMQELHIYVGDFAPKTLAPGQYGYIQYFGDEPAEYVLTHTANFTVPDTNGDGVWIIAHAVAFGEM